MTWPQATDYNAAVQSPALCFADPDLRAGAAAGDPFGLPRPHSGSFADVYQILGAGGAAWAAKCFTRPVGGLAQRYQAISEHLAQQRLPFMVDFVYLEEGIKVRGRPYPVLKMKWVEGLRLNEFVAQHLDRPAVLERLGQMWLRLARDLREARLGHGDLQHGNVLLVPGSKAQSLALRLIDYDGLYVPALADCPSGEVGHPNYQHPQRQAGGMYDAEVDRFAHLVIVTALRCLRAGGAALWERHDSGENLLFREDDFLQPAKSELWPELWALKDAEARALAGHLLLASQGPALAVPLLDEVVSAEGVKPLTVSEEVQIRALLPAETRPPRRVRSATTAMRAWEEIPPLPVPLASTGPELPLEPFRAAEETRTAATPPPLPPRLPRSVPPPLPPPQRVASPRSLRARLALAGASAVGLLLLVGLVRALRPTPPPPEEPSPARLVRLPPVTLRGGEQCEVEVVVKRNGYPGPLLVEVENAPDGVGHETSLALPAGRDRATLRLTAGPKAKSGQGYAVLTLTAGGRKAHVEHLSIRLNAR